MAHIFDVEDAKKYGILPAVILQNIKFWQEKSMANGKNFHEGRYWVYNSVKAWTKLFPYATKDQIRRALDSLRADGAVVTGCFNTNIYDRTIWYSTSEPLAESPNLVAEDAKPIPVVMPLVINTPLPPRGEERASKDQINYQLVIDAYHEQLPELPKVQVLSDKRKRYIKQRWIDRKKAGKFTDDASAKVYWTKFFQRLTESDLLMGRSTKWKADLEWIMTESHFIKIIEGSYHNV